MFFQELSSLVGRFVFQCWQVFHWGLVTIQPHPRIQTHKSWGTPNQNIGNPCQESEAHACDSEKKVLGLLSNALTFFPLLDKEGLIA